MPRPVTVLQVLAQDDLGGTELMLASLVERLDRTRVECELALLSPPGPIAARLSAAGVRIHPLGNGGLVRSTLRIGRLLRSRSYDVVNAYGFRAGLAARVAARVAPATKVVVGVRGLLVTEVERSDSPKARLAQAVERLTGGWVDLYDSNSRGAADLIAARGVERSRIAYIPNGIDTASWPTGNGAVRSQPPLISCVARFVARKRHIDLLEALALLDRRGTRFRAVLAGTGPTLERCTQRTHELGLTSRVEFPGRIDAGQVAELLARTDVACLPSLWEGMPGFAMEAMAASVPVVATDVNGADELIVDGESGLLVSAEDPPALARALEAVIGDAQLARRLGAAGRVRIEHAFSLDAMVAAKQRLYERVAAA